MATTIFSNRQGLRDYTVMDKFEVGIVLQGWEVKSLKAGHLSAAAAFVQVVDSELWIKGMSVANWKGAPIQPKIVQERDRKLLAHRSQVHKIAEFSKRPGYTVIPLEIYITDQGLIKLQVAIAKGKRKFERKQVLKDRDQKREMQREISKHS